MAVQVLAAPQELVQERPHANLRQSPAAEQSGASYVWAEGSTTALKRMFESRILDMSCVLSTYRLKVVQIVNLQNVVSPDSRFEQVVEALLHQLED